MIPARQCVSIETITYFTIFRGQYCVCNSVSVFILLCNPVHILYRLYTTLLVTLTEVVLTRE